MNDGFDKIMKDINSAKELLELKKRTELKKELILLEEKLNIVNSMQEKLDIKDRILEIKIELEETKPRLAVYSSDCLSCGS